MKADKPPKYIHDYLINKGFGLDKKTNYYMSRINNYPLFVSVHFSKNENFKNLYGICLGLNYPVSANGIQMIPPEVDSIKTNGQLLMCEDFVDEVSQLWDFDDKETALIKLNDFLPKCLRTVSDPKLMHSLLKYLMSESDVLPDEFKNIETPYLVRRETPNRLLFSAMYEVLNNDFDAALFSLDKLPSWMIGDFEKKIINDCNLGFIKQPDSNIEYLDAIEAGSLEFSV